MARLYATLINKGLKTIKDVPTALNKQVQALLKEMAG